MSVTACEENNGQNHKQRRQRQSIGYERNTLLLTYQHEEECDNEIMMRHSKPIGGTY